VYTIHHPAGLATKVSADCKVYPTTAEQPVEHDCSTVGGSSGAPLIGRDGQVVALHFEGAYPRSMTAGEIEQALLEGRVFRNKAKPMRLVRERLQEAIQ
jgi:V8-like Glu-specific endopeptidase